VVKEYLHTTVCKIFMNTNVPRHMSVTFTKVWKKHPYRVSSTKSIWKKSM